LDNAFLQTPSRADSRLGFPSFFLYSPFCPALCSQVGLLFPCKESSLFFVLKLNPTAYGCRFSTPTCTLTGTTGRFNQRSTVGSLLEVTRFKVYQGPPSNGSPPFRTDIQRALSFSLPGHLGRQPTMALGPEACFFFSPSFNVSFFQDHGTQPPCFFSSLSPLWGPGRQLKIALRPTSFMPQENRRQYPLSGSTLCTRSAFSQHSSYAIFPLWTPPSLVSPHKGGPVTPSIPLLSPLDHSPPHPSVVFFFLP